MSILGFTSGRRLRFAVAAVAVLGVATMSGCSSSGPGAGSNSGSKSTSADGSTKGKILIGYSQAFSSNAWQKANNKAVETAVNALKAQGKDVDYKFTDANNSATTQISQIQDFILQKVSVLMINPTSSTALNGVIAKAIAAHIPTLVFSDGPVTSQLPYELVCDLKSTGKALTDYIAQRLNGSGNILNVRGVAGTGGDQSFQAGVEESLKAHPGLKVINTVYGNWDNATTSSRLSSILPGLPKIDAVIQQGGEGFGAAQAFKAADRPEPLIVMGNQGAELSWWNEQNKANGYTTFSIGTNPGIGAAAVYIAYDMAQGKNPPNKTMVFPNLNIAQADLPKYLDVPLDGQATQIYNQAWTEANVIK